MELITKNKQPALVFRRRSGRARAKKRGAKRPVSSPVASAYSTALNDVPSTLLVPEITLALVS